MTSRVLAVLQVLFTLQRSGSAVGAEHVARILGRSPPEVKNAIQKLIAWRLLDSQMKPTRRGTVTVARLRKRRSG